MAYPSIATVEAPTRLQADTADGFHLRHAPAGAGEDDMVEVRMPGGVMAAEQFLALDMLAGDCGSTLTIAGRDALAFDAGADGGDGEARIREMETAWIDAGRRQTPGLRRKNRALTSSPGPNPQGDGLWSLTLAVPDGVIGDNGPVRLRSALRDIVARWRTPVALTETRGIVLCDIDPEFVFDIETDLARYGVDAGRNVADILPSV